MRNYEHAARLMTQWVAERDITAAELSRQTGIDAGILRSVLTGKKKSISTRNLLILARFFGFEMQEMMDLFANGDVTG